MLGLFFNMEVGIIDNLREAEKHALEKLGFVIEELNVTHKKLEIRRKLTDFYGFTTLQELEQFAKELLRNQCRVTPKNKKRGES